MSHYVICAICQERFNRDRIQAIKISARRYAHAQCAEDSGTKGELMPVLPQKEKKKTEEKEKKEVKQDEDLVKLNEYVFKLFGKDTNWARVKQQIKEYTEKYSLTNSYIERLGICMYLENYIADNDIDFTNPAAVTYRETLIAYQNEVQQYLVDYEKLLQSNTVAFVGIVKEMGTYVDYADIKPLYDKALNNYYYAMNTDTEEAKQAVILFNEYGEKLKALEENGAMFVGYSKNLTSKRQAQKYRALVNCAKCIEIGVDEGVSGVKKAMETYNEALAEYNASIGAVNGEISEISDVVSAVRSNSIASTVLAIIKGFFSK